MKSHLPIAVLLLITACSNPIPFQVYKSVAEAYDVWIVEDNDNRALQMVNRTLEEWPGNTDARVLRARIHLYLEHYDEALSDIKHAALNYQYYSRTRRATVYADMGRIYQAIGNDRAAIKAMRRAIFLANFECRDNLNEYRIKLAEHYQHTEQAKQEGKLYRKILNREPYNSQAMLAMARICLNKQAFHEGLMWTERVHSQHPTENESYPYKIEILSAMNRTHEAINETFYYLAGFKDFSKADMDLALRTLASDSEYAFEQLAGIESELDQDQCEELRLDLLKEIGNYREALAYYEQYEVEDGPYHLFLYEKANCYANMGLMDQAIAEISYAIEMAPSEYIRSYLCLRGDILRRATRYREAINDYSESSEYDPTSAYEYYSIGYCRELMGDTDQALSNYNQGIAVDPHNSWLRLNRGDLLMERGHAIAARRDYREVLAAETEPRRNGCRHFALLGLGLEDEAINWMERVIKNYPYYGAAYYDYACLLSRMGRTTQALTRLSEALKLGYRFITLIEHDLDIEPLRELPEYKALIEEYRDSVQIVSVAYSLGGVI